MFFKKYISMFLIKNNKENEYYEQSIKIFVMKCIIV